MAARGPSGTGRDGDGVGVSAPTRCGPIARSEGAQGLVKQYTIISS
jgi:hypothetical protein